MFVSRRRGTRPKERDNPAFQLELFQPLRPEHCRYVRGFSALFLGKVPTYEVSGPGCTDYCVEKLLDSYNIDEGRAHAVYLDIKDVVLLMYYVDEDGKLLHTKVFDLARISFCCGDHVTQPRIFSWVYKQETEVGFQLECYAVRCATQRKPRLLAQIVHRACHCLYVEVQAALKASKAFSKACLRKDGRSWQHVGNDAAAAADDDDQDDDGEEDQEEEEKEKDPNNSNDHSDDVINFMTEGDVNGKDRALYQSLSGPQSELRNPGRRASNGLECALGEHCLELEFDNDSVFGSPDTHTVSSVDVEIQLEELFLSPK